MKSIWLEIIEKKSLKIKMYNLYDLCNDDLFVRFEINFNSYDFILILISSKILVRKKMFENIEINKFSIENVILKKKGIHLHILLIQSLKSNQ